MNEFITIIFFGIITHVDLHPAAMNTAVLPAVMHHKPYLCVSQSDIVGNPPPGNFVNAPSVTNPGCPNQYEIDLTFAKVAFKNIDETTTSYTKEYKRYVPSLSLISKCRKLKSNVRSRTHAVGLGPDPKIAAYVDYPGGLLDVESYFAGRGKLDPKTNTIQDGPQCFACKVKLTMKTSAATVRVVLTKNGVQGEIPFDVLSTAILTVRNAPTQATQDHFKFHYDIFDSTDTDCATRSVVKKTGEKCDLVTCTESSLGGGGGSDSDVECSNTNYP
jgi:hypothetical protein